MTLHQTFFCFFGRRKIAPGFLKKSDYRSRKICRSDSRKILKNKYVYVSVIWLCSLIFARKNRCWYSRERASERMLCRGYRDRRGTRSNAEVARVGQGSAFGFGSDVLTVGTASAGSSLRRYWLAVQPRYITLSEVRSRLYQHRCLRPNTFFQHGSRSTEWSGWIKAEDFEQFQYSSNLRISTKKFVFEWSFNHS